MNSQPGEKISRVLVVDDDQLLNMLFCSFLESKGLVVLSADSVESAKTALRNNADLDLILLDYQLGDGVGLDLLKPDAVETYLCRPPVIMISANEEPNYLETCFRSGVHDYIIKPVNLSLLALKVEALIRTEAMRRLIILQNSELEKFKFEAEREEQIAKFTYDYLLDQNLNEFDGVKVWLKSFAAFSGDIALVKKSSNGNLFFLLADATGHGLSAAITIMPMVNIFRDLVKKGFHIQQLVIEINRKLVSDTPIDRFVAAIVFELNPYKQELSVWNGGMPSAFWLSGGEILQEYKSKHMSFGILGDDIFDANVDTFSLPPEGQIVAFSDGIIEQENAQGEDFGLPRLLQISKANPTDVINALASSLEQHAGTTDYKDDVTIALINPAKVFAVEWEQGTADQQQPVDSKSFRWELCLRGAQLASSPIPHLCNQFLQSMGVDQQRCQKMFAVIAEMVSNALDHGVLKLNSDLKDQPDGFLEYLNERELRLSQLTEKDFVSIKLNYKNNCLEVEVTDSGQGYKIVDRGAEVSLKYSGRGMQMIKKLSESVEIIPPGNQIKAVIH